MLFSEIFISSYTFPVKDKAKISPYHLTLRKQLLNRLAAFFGLFILSPIFISISLIIKLTSKGSAIFKQKRLGKDGKVFTLYKFRTMYVGAEKDKEKYFHLNEADGPVFKMRNDPRLTKFGKILARTGLDELPQLLNVIKGDMSLVGPRPLPVKEAEKLKKPHKVRELVKPGITSLWVIAGAHNLSFKKWMKLDSQYIKSASLKLDLYTIVETLFITLRGIVNQITRRVL